jgi:hypothetical protein
MDAWLAVLGGLIAGLVGLALFVVQHRAERLDAKADRERAALIELAGLLMPLLVEIERPLEARGYWVDNVREMRRLGTWVHDPAENAQKGPDWERIADLTQEIERRWWGELQIQISDLQMRELREEFYERSIGVAVTHAQPRVALTRLSECVEAALARIGELVGSDSHVPRDRPPRPAAPEVRNPLRPKSPE